jgi:hypothetical protein
MTNHIGDTNKMVSDTPISDSTPHNVAELGMLCRRLEREFNAANDRIKRLEEAGENLAMSGYFLGLQDDLKAWRKAKEAKP